MHAIIIRYNGMFIVRVLCDFQKLVFYAIKLQLSNVNLLAELNLSQNYAIQHGLHVHACTLYLSEPL